MSADQPIQVSFLVELRGAESEWYVDSFIMVDGTPASTDSAGPFDSEIAAEQARDRYLAWVAELRKEFGMDLGAA